MSKRWYRVLRAAIVVFVVVASLVAVGAVYESSASARDARLAAPGRLVAVGEHRLHLHCAGAGSPTVVLEAGGGNSSVTFRPLMRVLAASTRVCAYDRAGFGYSGSLHSERDAERAAAELLELLTLAGEAGPYVLVAHSMGGLYALPLDQVVLAPKADRREARAHALRTDFCSTAYAEAVALSGRLAAR